ncbi:MAG TPA: c-type cytochrome [Phycisphaerae bacterium]|nr:c-type cytochrome [Phycisphaerae bacterium]HRW52520.1 c-type cytochrome [Phycisphaerae bacterium]
MSRQIRQNRIHSADAPIINDPRPQAETARASRQSVARNARHAKVTIAGALLMLFAIRCAGPVAMTDAIDHQYETDYVARLNHENADGRAAWLKWKAETENRGIEELEREDAEISSTRNPFDAYRDSDAVRRGAVLYKYHCARCHGDDARGHGPSALPDYPANDFHDFGQRFAATLHRGAPRRWFRSITNGTGDIVTYPDEPPGPAMPAFGAKLSREQIWLLITYLQSLDVHFPEATAPQATE